MPVSIDHSFLAAVIQLSSTSDHERNFREASDLIERAAGSGAQLITTPENTNFLGPHRQKVAQAEQIDGPTCERFGRLAERHQAYLLLGSFNEKGSDESRCHNTSVLFSPQGKILAIYRKIHLFDVDVSDEVRFQESATVEPGEETVCVKTPLAKLGLTICYDLRFPEIYRRLVEDGAEVLTVPSAFTLMTGKDHWYPLLRARAIENQSWVLAPAQSGRHDDQGLRHSYGHSLIIDPWGQVRASVGEGLGWAIAEIDVDRVHATRRAMPISEHRRI